MKSLFTTFFLTFCPFLLLLGQQPIVTGHVYDFDTGETLPGVNVFVSIGGGTTTNADGEYRLELPLGHHEIVFRFVGYEVQKIALEATMGKTLTRDVKLVPANVLLPTAVVTAGRFEQPIEEITVSMEVIKPALIESRSTNNMEEFMDQVPGVHITDGQANIRGGGGFSYGAGSRVLVLVDDLPMVAADANDVKWNFLPVENLEQVEVMKGASSVLYGSSALNGVINLRTAYPKDKPQTRINVFQGVYSDPMRTDTLGERGHPLQWWGDVNPMFTGLNFFHSRKIKQFDLVVGGNGFSDQGYREGETDQRARLNFNTRYRFKKTEGLSVGLNANVQRGQGALFLLWQDADSGAYRPQGGLDTATTTLTAFTSWRVNVDPFVVYQPNESTRHSLRTRYFYSANLASQDQSAHPHLIYAEYQFLKRFNEKFSLTAGAVNMWSEVNSELYGDHTGNNIAGYLQVDRKFGRLHISGGIRGEYFRVDTAETRTEVRLGGNLSDTKKTGLLLVSDSPIKPVVRLGFNYQLFVETYLRASYGEGYRFPSIGEKFVNTNVGFLKVFPNESLQPETGRSAEVGVKQGVKLGKWKGYVDVAAFVTEYRNMMEFSFGVWAPDSTPIFEQFNYVGFRSVNVGRARVAGTELSIIGVGKIKSVGFSLLGGYTYLDPVNLNTDSNYLATMSAPDSRMLKYRFRHLAKLDVQADWRKWAAGVSARYYSFMQNVDLIFEQEFVLPGVKAYRERNNTGDYVIDVRASYQLTESSKVAFVSKNVLNREYMGRPGDIQPPRTMLLQYSLSF